MLTKRAPILKDVARKAGVGIGTASVVVNGAPSNKAVSEATRQRILAAAAELNYTPNAVARGLMKVRLKLVGATFPQADPTWITSDHYGVSVLTGIISGSHARGYSTTIFHRPWEDAGQSATGYRGQGIDGFLVVAPDLSSTMVGGLSSLGIPVVVISTPSDEYGVPSIALDNAIGVRQALEHLVAFGHRKIAYISDYPDQYDFGVRREAFLKISTEFGISVPSIHVPVLDTSGLHGDVVHKECARQLLMLPERPTAVFACNDAIAIFVMEVARDLGIKVPEELSIVGFDDGFKASQVIPALTTVRQPLVEMGRTAADMLVSLVEGEPVEARTHLFRPELVVRGTTASV